MKRVAVRDITHIAHIRKIVGGNVRHLRKGNGMKQVALAERLGWVAKEPGEKDNRSMVSQIERGHVGVSLETIMKLAGVFRVSMGDLLRQDLIEEYPDPLKIPEVKQSELSEPEKALSGVAPRSIKKQKVFRYSDLLEAIDPPHDGFPIPSAPFRLPDWTAGRKPSKMVCAVLDTEIGAGDYNKGVIVCVDTDDIPTLKDPDGIGQYVIRVGGRPYICKGEKKGHILHLLNPPVPKREIPMVFDVRGRHKEIVGRIVWVFGLLK